MARNHWGGKNRFENGLELNTRLNLEIKIRVGSYGGDFDIENFAG